MINLSSFAGDIEIRRHGRPLFPMEQRRDKKYDRKVYKGHMPQLGMENTQISVSETQDIQTQGFMPSFADAFPYGSDIVTQEDIDLFMDVF